MREIKGFYGRKDENVHETVCGIIKGEIEGIFEGTLVHYGLRILSFPVFQPEDIYEEGGGKNGGEDEEKIINHHRQGKNENVEQVAKIEEFYEEIGQQDGGKHGDSIGQDGNYENKYYPCHTSK